MQKTMSSTQTLVFVFLATLTFLLCVVSATTTPDDSLPQVKVHINNTVESKSPVMIHCKDNKSRDLEAKQVPYFGTYEFEFEPSRWGSTRYSCSFQGDFNDGQMKWFDIYVEIRDAVFCGTDCSWFVKQSGPCLHTSKDRCFPWDYVS